MNGSLPRKLTSFLNNLLNLILLPVFKIFKGNRPDSSNEKTLVQSNKTEALLDLLPKGQRQLVVAGQQPVKTQTGFANKMHAVVVTGFEEGALDAEEAARRFDLGYACKKGLKPESPNQVNLNF